MMKIDFPPGWSFVLFSESAALANDEDGLAGYWSNEFGWCMFEDATRFSAEEMEAFTKPMTAKNDAQWMALVNLQ